MSLVFAYRQIAITQPAIALGGRMTRPRPLVHVSLLGPTGLYLRDGFLDTAADDTVFPEVAALQIGLDLTNAPLGSVTGVAAAGPSLVRFAQVTLRLTDGIEFCEWPAWVGFTSAPLRKPLLGFAGCLQFFEANFKGGREEVELTVESHYPGRTGRLIP